ncbi:MAG: cysteine desulfurase [Vicinamibacterales bacterium]|jgi:cysteine desulfurase/selenocysteine lyase|nr:cysteine desulfurase CsdA [Acidobacteriota bacterium]MDP6371668.1 cysteine desulfurase [Vicinamibacterales bacterium]MDP6608001.1 cysteine desulfurase [Vicinamibacterales bacterium]HAK54618.1 cysteine desulfurase CsdA [Acidobacteriota bacterium]|tara:strand:- start:4580 stop:5833 length:1254 start_codon:yes stop_codon:yes gene_type:complete
MSQAATPTAAPPRFDVTRVRKEFPILGRKVHGQPLVYLDNAATTQKPRVVLDALVRYYTEHNANIHRGVHYLSETATQAHEAARRTVQRFVNARDAREIVFTRNATEGINLVAHSFGQAHVREGDEIVITGMEHHSNIVPWQLLCERTGARLRVAPITDEGELVWEEVERLIGPRTKIVAVVHLSNSLGTVNPVERIVELAHQHDAAVLVDGAQSAYHLPVDVQAMDCDFYVATGHKLYGPTGIGLLYGKAERLEQMPPYQGGGDMISSVTFEKTTYNELPYKFEAGTPHIAGAIGLAAAIDYLTGVGLDQVAAHERDLLAYGTSALRQIPGLRLVGTATNKASILSFVMDGVHPHDVGTIVDRMGVAIRTGHHCTQPVMDRMGISATARASLAMYSTRDDIDTLVAAVGRAREVFA